MKRETLFCLATAMCAASAASADKLPGTMNFKNDTATRINQTVSELSSNEKNIEVGDFDNDDDLDVVIAVAQGDFGQRKNKLYRNDGGVFNEVSNLIPSFSIVNVSRIAFLRDYDGDGWLDLYIINDANSDEDIYYRNEHPGNVFTGFTAETNLHMPFESVNACAGFGCTGAACNGVSFDADEDGDIDIYCANYPNSSQDNMYFNDGAADFTNVTGTNVPFDVDYTVDAATADMNNDGLIDILLSQRSDVNDPSLIYYNNNLGAGSGTGDFRYTGSAQNLGNAGNHENAMVPGDFDNDDDMDIYATNRIGFADRLLENTGNDGANKAVFSDTLVLPKSVSSRETIKATVADLNDDGRLDIFVMAEGANGGNERPVILRNTTVDGLISFVDWTPGNTFPNGTLHEGWHSAIFDTNGDGDLDIFLGGWKDDHLFESVISNETTEGALRGAGILPDLFNLDPVAVVGGGQLNEADVYTANDIGSDSFISVVLNGPDDYVLELIDPDDDVVAASDRGGLGVEEALRAVTSAGSHKVRITTVECASPFNLNDDCGIGTGDLIVLLGAWGKNPGHPADFDGDDIVGTTDLLDMLGAWGPSEYILEVLSRTGI